MVPSRMISLPMRLRMERLTVSLGVELEDACSLLKPVAWVKDGQMLSRIGRNRPLHLSGTSLWGCKCIEIMGVWG